LSQQGHKSTRNKPHCKRRATSSFTINYGKIQKFVNEISSFSHSIEEMSEILAKEYLEACGLSDTKRSDENYVNFDEDVRKEFLWNLDIEFFWIENEQLFTRF